MSLNILDRLTADSKGDGTPDVRGARGRLARGRIDALVDRSNLVQPLEALVDGVKMPEDLVEPGVHLEAQATHHPLDVRHDYFPMELGQNRQREWFVRHGSYPTAAMDVLGPAKTA